MGASIDRRALVIGCSVFVWLLVGFTLGDHLGAPAWTVAAVARIGVAAVTRRPPSLRAVPVGPAALALSLATLVVGAASALRVERVFAIDGRGGEAAVFLAGVVGGNGMNNLPATVIALPALETHPERAWPLLLGVNLGATLWITGALSSLLWQSTTARLGAPVSARRYAAVGWRVGLPALAAALTVPLLLAG